MGLVNLSRGGQPVAVEGFHKNRSFRLVLLNPGTSCALATQPLRFYMPHICLKNRPEKRLGAEGIPFADLDGSSALHNTRGNGSSWLSQLSETFEGGLMDVVRGRARTACMKAGHTSQFTRYCCGLQRGATPPLPPGLQGREGNTHHVER
jgi:hypothetical protein